MTYRKHSSCAFWGLVVLPASSPRRVNPGTPFRGHLDASIRRSRSRCRRDLEPRANRNRREEATRRPAHASWFRYSRYRYRCRLLVNLGRGCFIHLLPLGSVANFLPQKGYRRQMPEIQGISQRLPSLPRDDRFWYGRFEKSTRFHWKKEIQMQAILESY